MNYKLEINALVKWFENRKPPPTMVQLYPTNKCNLKCIFCVQSLGIYNVKEDVKKKRWLEVVKELCEMGVKRFLISGGGEPLLVPETTISIMKLIRKFNGNGRIITNGTLWTSKLVKEIIRLNWECVTFSIDGPNEKIHDFLRGVPGTFLNILKGLNLFIEFKNKMNTKFPRLEFTTVLNIYNYRLVNELIELAHKYQIESINFEPICINNPTCEKLKLNVSQRKKFFSKIVPLAEKLVQKYRININFQRLKEVKLLEKAGNLYKEILNKPKKPSFLDIPCYEPWLWPKIEANGEVWPCSSIALHENIKEKSFKEIWFGEKFNKFREQIRNKQLPKECSNCVLTHLSINNEIRKYLENYIKNNTLKIY